MEQEILDILYITTHQYLLSHYGIFSSYDTYTSLLATNASNEVIEGINFGTVTVTQGVGSVFFFRYVPRGYGYVPPLRAVPVL